MTRGRTTPGSRRIHPRAVRGLVVVPRSSRADENGGASLDGVSRDVSSRHENAGAGLRTGRPQGSETASVTGMSNDPPDGRAAGRAAVRAVGPRRSDAEARRTPAEASRIPRASPIQRGARRVVAGLPGARARVWRRGSRATWPASSSWRRLGRARATARPACLTRGCPRGGDDAPDRTGRGCGERVRRWRIAVLRPSGQRGHGARRRPVGCGEFVRKPGARVQPRRDGSVRDDAPGEVARARLHGPSERRGSGR